MSNQYDVVIIGGGIAGASLAYRLAGRRSAALLEREPQFGYHSTGRSAAEFSRQFHAPAIGRLTAASYDFLASPPDGFSPVDLLKRRGNLVIAAAGHRDRLAPFYAEVCTTSPESRWLGIDEALTMAPFLRAEYVAGAFFDPDCWDIDVDALLQGYMRGARRGGVSVRGDCHITAITRRADGYCIDTGDGPVEAGILVDAAGGWADAVARQAGIAGLDVVPHRRTAITVDVPSGIDVSVVPEVSEVTELFYMKPEGGRLMLSPADATPCEPGDVQPEDIDVAYAMHYLEAATILPAHRLSHKWAGLRSFAPDRLPVVGFSPDDPRFFWLAGQGGSGIMTSPALSRWAADLLCGCKPADDLVGRGLDPFAFSPARFG